MVRITETTTRKHTVREAVEGLDVDDIMLRLGALPKHADRGILQAVRQSAAAGYKMGLRKIPAATGLSPGILVGYKRWFVDHTRHPGVAKAWLGTDPLRRIGEWVDTVDESGRRVRRRANLDFPAEAARRVVDTQVYPEMIKVAHGVVEREILKAVARG